jgi:hypothetical protein
MRTELVSNTIEEAQEDSEPDTIRVEPLYYVDGELVYSDGTEYPATPLHESRHSSDTGDSNHRHVCW